MQRHVLVADMERGEDDEENAHRIARSGEVHLVGATLLDVVDEDLAVDVADGVLGGPVPVRVPSAGMQGSRTGAQVTTRVSACGTSGLMAKTL